MPDLTVANVRAIDRRLKTSTDAAMRRVITAVALAGERQAKLNASNGSHKKGTPTPASKGQGPAVISGDLRRAITHDPTRKQGAVWVSRIGVSAGASYGKFVEDLGYEFMTPVTGLLVNVVIPAAAAVHFGKVRMRGGEIVG
jgi:hypothetical protein